jgi:hypothetical protein
MQQQLFEHHPRRRSKGAPQLARRGSDNNGAQRLGDHGCWNPKFSAMGSEKCRAATVIGVVGISGGQKHASVDDDCHRLEIACGEAGCLLGAYFAMAASQIATPGRA